MKTPTYETFLEDPAAVMTHVRREASRARNLALDSYLLKPLANFCGRLLAIRGVKLRLDPRAPRGVFQ